LSARRRVVLLGKGELAVKIADWFLKSPEHELWRVVPVVPEPSWAPSLIAWCKESGVPYVESGHFQDLPGVREPGWKTDLAFSCFYDKIIKDWFIAKCGRILNLHNGPLPRYRGVSPINWALKNGERQHGLTIHEITPGIDDGPIVAQALYPIDPEKDEVIDVFKRSLEHGWDLFQKTMPMLDAIKAVPQDESKALYYSRQQDPLLGERRGFTRGAK
jgi:methionyl-tRNA formyltransferase